MSAPSPDDLERLHAIRRRPDGTATAEPLTPATASAQPFRRFGDAPARPVLVGDVARLVRFAQRLAVTGGPLYGDQLAAACDLAEALLAAVRPDGRGEPQ